MNLTTGSGTIFEKINEITRMMDDTNTQIDLRLNEKLGRKVNEMEDTMKKFVNRDITRINSELLNLNGTISKFCGEQRNLEEKVKTKLITTKSVQKQLTEMGGKADANEILKESQV